MILSKLVNVEHAVLPSMRVEIPTPEYHLVTFSYSSRHLRTEFLLSRSEMPTYSIFPETKSHTFNHAGSNLQCLLTGILHDNTCQCLSTFHHPNI